MVVLNIPHGPDETDARFSEARDKMDQLYRSSNPRLSALFQADLARITKELEPLATQEEGESLMDAMWRFAHERNSFKRTGYRAKKARHLQVLHQAR